MNEESDVGIRAVMIYLSPTDFSGDASALNAFISQNKFTKAWWNFLPFLYVVRTDSTVHEVKEAAFEFVGNRVSFVVAEVDPIRFTGYLRPGGWQAFKKDIRLIKD